MFTDTKEKAKIEAIYPLSRMQEGLLFHHLSNEHDQGFLQIQTRLEGSLNEELLKKAWEATTKRHQILRTTVHWKNMEKPIQVVRPFLDLDWNFHDRTSVQESDYENDLLLFKSRDEERIINFEKGPLSKINLLKYSDKVHYIIWNCHHLLLDGWSSSILIKDIFEFYEGFFENKPSVLEAVPSTKSYLNWVKNQDKNEAAQCWKEIFNDVSHAPRFNIKGVTSEGEKRNEKLILSENQTSSLNTIAQKYKVTLNSLFQGIWGILIGTFFEENNVIFGTTVSGRNNSFPNMNLLAGMFVNVLPTVVKLGEKPSLEKLFQEIQKQQQKARKFEHVTRDEIVSWVGWKNGEHLFDSLFIFENYPWEKIEKCGVIVKSFESGITTTYPITFTVSVAEKLEINLITNNKIISAPLNAWFIKSIKTLIKTILTKPNITIEEISSLIPRPHDLVTQLTTLDKKENLKKEPYYAAKNELQLKITQIWETVLGIHNIGIHDNFFKIGGKSLIAVKMFSLINEKLNLKLPPTTILKYPTIATLSELIKGNTVVDTWDYMVPLRANGNKKPLFCIHGGGGHVFFYNPLANNIDADRPVYALQPSGLNNEDQMHKSIQEMAISYVKEITKVQTSGPYNLMVYCFSTAVGIEMAKILNDKNETTYLIVADSVINQEDIVTPDRLKMRITGFLNRLMKNPVKGIRAMLITKVNRFISPILVKFFGSEGERNIEKIRKNLMEIYNKYRWKTRNKAKVSLILTEKSLKSINEEYIKGWESISDNPIKVFYNSGNHLTLFEGEDVKDLAQNIEKAISESN